MSQHASSLRISSVVFSAILTSSFFGTFLAGCSGDTAGSSYECTDNSDCEGGFVCTEHECVQLCYIQGDCDDGQLCSPDGICVVPQDGDLPSITAILGNNSTDSGRIIDGLMVSGTTLSAASFELRGLEQSVLLAIRSQSPTEVELVLPVDVRQGAYTLVATNQVGSDQDSVELLLPDITGNSIVEKVNAADTTARLELNRLSADVQKRVSGSCGAGSAIRTIDADGLVVCDAQRSDAEIASAIGQNLQSGAIPASDGSTLVKSSLHMGDTGFVGLATLEPKALLDVAVGFSYSHTLDTIDAGVALPTPRCECDKNNSTKECGTDPSEYNHHGDFCYDWSGDDDWATYALVPDAEPPLSGLAVTDEGKVGIGTFEPLAKLDIRGGVVLDDRSWYRDYSISTALPAVVLNRAGNPLPLNFVGLFFCSVTGTGAPGSSYWMVKRRFDDPVHIEKIVSFDSVGSNTPEIYDDGGTIKIRLYSHANKYPVRCHAQQLW